MGRLLAGMARRDPGAVREQLAVARHEIMAPVSAAAMESYARAYPHLVRLHMLQEVADAAALIQVAPGSLADVLQICLTYVPLELLSPDLCVCSSDRQQLLEIYRRCQTRGRWSRSVGCSGARGWRSRRRGCWRGAPSCRCGGSWPPWSG